MLVWHLQRLGQQQLCSLAWTGWGVSLDRRPIPDSHITHQSRLATNFGLDVLSSKLSNSYPETVQPSRHNIRTAQHCAGTFELHACSRKFREMPHCHKLRPACAIRRGDCHVSKGSCRRSIRWSARWVCNFETGSLSKGSVQRYLWSFLTMQPFVGKTKTCALKGFLDLCTLFTSCTHSVKACSTFSHQKMCLPANIRPCTDCGS